MVKEICAKWFDCWETGDFENLPISEDFEHCSPYGTIIGRDTYLDLVRANRAKFLENKIQIEDDIYFEDKAAFRYKIHNTAEHFEMEVSEWIYVKDGLIQRIHAYYQVGDIPEERELNPNDA